MTLAPINRPREDEDKQAATPEFPYLQGFTMVAANNTAADPHETVVGQDFIMMTLVQHEPALMEEEYPVLAAIWDNDDDAIFDTM